MKTKAILEKKLRSRAGESIAETLSALLIITLALTMLAGSIVSAAKINSEIRNMDVEFSTEGEDTSSSTVTITHSSGHTTVEVNLYTTDDDNEYTYYTQK